MRIQLLGKNKLGLVDGTWKKEDFRANLGYRWDRCNTIVLGWIMSSISKELLSGLIYANDASKVWEDMRERLHQGTNSVSVYFTSLKEFWDDYDSMTPPHYDCVKSLDFVAHLKRQRLMQFLMGLNETYEQARSQILMTHPTPNVNKAYSVIIERESQRSVANMTITGENSKATTFLTTRGGNYQKPRKNSNLHCAFYKMKGHTNEGYYKIIGYLGRF